MQYRQCLLKRGDTTQVSWLPIKHAQPGKILRLRDQGVWTNGWVVVEAWETIEEARLPDAHDDIKAHRRATGDCESCF